MDIRLAAKTQWDRFRGWYRSPEGEPFRREVAWTREWLFRGGGRVWLAALVAIYFFRSEVWGFMNSTPIMSSWTSAMSSSLPMAFLLAPVAYPLRSPLSFTICWGGWLYLIHRRALTPISSGRLEDLLLTDIDLADLLPALIVAPFLWLVTVASVDMLIDVVKPLLLPDTNAFATYYPRWSWGTWYATLLNGEASRFIVNLFLAAFLTGFTFWNVISHPKIAWVGVFAFVGYWVYYTLVNLVQLPVWAVYAGFLRVFPTDPDSSGTVLWQIIERVSFTWIISLPTFFFLALLTRRYLRKLRSPAARLKLSRPLDRVKSPA